MHLVQAIIDHDNQLEVDQERMSSTTTDNDNGTATATDTPPVAQDQDQQEGKNNVEDPSPTTQSTPTSSTAEVVEEEEVSEQTKATEEVEDGEENNQEEVEKEEDGEDEEKDEDAIAEEEARAIAQATKSADASYKPPASLLNSASPYPLIRSVDGMSLKKYDSTPAVYLAKKLPIPLRGKINVPIPISIGGSVVEYSVESEDFDIGFGVVAEREEGVTVVSEPARVDSHLQAVSGKFLVGSVPCALIFTFDNEYSWFREKKITYQITVKPPTKDNVVLGRKLRARAALKIISEDKKSAEERYETAAYKRQELAQEVDRLEKELAEKKKSLGVVEKEESWLKKRVQVRSVQEDLLNRRLADGWEDENETIGNETPTERADI